AMPADDVKVRAVHGGGLGESGSRVRPVRQSVMMRAHRLGRPPGGWYANRSSSPPCRVTLGSARVRPGAQSPGGGIAGDTRQPAELPVPGPSHDMTAGDEAVDHVLAEAVLDDGPARHPG